MSNEKYVVTHDDDVLGHDLTRRDAILLTARYDGWGAEFARDDDGVMALRTSGKHIGYNPWHARGTEKPLFGFTSSLEDDEAAITELEGQLINVIDQRGGARSLYDVYTHDEYARMRLKVTVDSYEGDTGPGRWLVQERITTTEQPSGFKTGLAYEWPEDPAKQPGRGGFTGDEPWTQWGGNTIIQSAGCAANLGFSQENVDTCVVDWLPESQRTSPDSRRPAESFFWHLRDNTILEKTGIVQIPGIAEDHPLLIQLPGHLMRDFSLARTKIDDAIVETNRVTQQGRNGEYFETLQAELAKASIRTLEQPTVLTLKHYWDSDCQDVLGDMSEDAQTDVVITNVLAVIEHGDEDVFYLDSGSEIDPSNRLLINIDRIKITYPRPDRYGVPDCATDAGARKYLKDLGFRVPNNFELEVDDSGDDTSMQLTIWGKAPESIIETPEPQASRQLDR